MLRYDALLRLRENCAGEGRVDEAFLQRLWFEETHQNLLTTTDGERIEILQPGFWNRRGGPDFLQAALKNEKGEVEVGSVEIHCSSIGWHQHRHDNNPAYDKTILHVIWEKTAKDFFPRTRERLPVRQAELSRQLRLPLARLKSLFTSSEEERKIGARAGRCSRILSEWDNKRLTALLEDVGWLRFQQKKALWQMREEATGRAQALWLGVAESLGYAENKEAFRFLAQKLKIEDLLKIQPVLRREALLFGAANFLPDKILPQDGQWFRQLWNYWWADRAEWESCIPSRDLWKFAGVRPLNRPERRLAVLALLAQNQNWKTFLQLAKQGEPKTLEEWLAKLSHPFWDSHYTLRSAVKSGPSALIGKERIQSLLFNVVWPLHRFEDAKLLKWLRQPAGHNYSSRIAAVRLLGNRRLPLTLLAREGLSQIYADFCSRDQTRCEQCGFSEWAKEFSLDGMS
ncbi:MAG: DUF2851 family protein [bacterium]